MNIIEFLEENNIKIWYDGKNISDGYIGIKCLFCNDSSNHLGIRVKDLKISCWKCGKHSLVDLVKEVLQIDFKAALNIARSIERDDLIRPIITDKKSGDISNARTILPFNSRDIFPRIHIQYLRSRGFNARKIIRQYNLKACYRSGKYRYRIIIPCYMHGKLVSFTARDITDQQKPKYLAASKAETNFPPGQCIYNFDTVERGGKAILVEGPFDVFRMGHGSICFFGVRLTGQRMIEIANKDLDKLYIFFDTEPQAQKYARSLAVTLAPLVKNVEILQITNPAFVRRKLDPGELSFEHAARIKNWLGFKK